MSDLKLGIRNNHVRRDLNVDMTSNLITGALLKTALTFFGNRKNKKDTMEIDNMTRGNYRHFRSGDFYKKIVDGRHTA